MDWTKIRFQRDSWESPTIEKEIARSGYYDKTWCFYGDQPDSGDELYKAAYEAGFWNGVNIYIRKKDSFDIIAFAGDRADGYLNERYFMENRHFILAFIDVFYQQVDDILGTGKNRIFIPEKIGFKNPEEQIKEVEAFVKETREIIYGKKIVPLTDRQREVLFNLSEGNSYKMIARILDVSPRTIEAHIKNIKFSTDCYSKKNLIEYFRKYLDS